MGCETGRFGFFGRWIGLPVRDDGSGDRLDKFPVDVRVLKRNGIDPEDVLAIDILPGEDGVLSIFLVGEGSEVLKVPVCKRRLPGDGVVAMLDKNRLTPDGTITHGARDGLNPLGLFVAGLFGSGFGRSV